jgi:hypothetical protein
MAQNPIYEPHEEDKVPMQPDARTDLVKWVMPKVEQWRRVRDNAYEAKWDEYYRIWRGKWAPDSKNRRTERSKLIAPATQIAVDMTVSEILEATFGRERFVDLGDDVADEQKEDALIVADRLVEDLRKDGIVPEISQVALNGALYGNFIAKIVTEVSTKAVPKIMEVTKEDGTVVKEVRKIQQEVVKVYPVAVEPGQLVVDPSATDIDGGLGAAHEFRLGIHTIKRRQAEGTYYSNVMVGASTRSLSTDERSELNELGKVEGPAADICEYHGLVPSRLLSKVRLTKSDPLADQIIANDDKMVEAVVTIANGTTLLRAIPNPSVMDDRALVSEQFDTVPNRFWGRGIVEKGYNTQRALDAELRARADALAWTNNPMLAGDLTKLPPQMDLGVWPGKFWGTMGPPRETLEELRFGDISQSTFAQASELERMLQQATGAVDPAAIGQNVRDQSFGASAVAVSGIVKRTKRIMLNFETFLTTLMRRIVWRKMKYEPDRYPADYEFVVRGSIGLMAREIEQQFLSQLMQTTDAGSPEHLQLMKLVVENSSSPHRAEIVKQIDERLKPPDPEEVEKQQRKAEQMEQLQMQTAVAQYRNIEADTAKKMAEAGYKGAQEMLTKIDADLKDDHATFEAIKIRNDLEETENQKRQLELQERNIRVQEGRLALDRQTRSSNQ